MNLSQQDIEERIAGEWFSGQMKDLAKEWSMFDQIIQQLWQINRSENEKMAWRSAYLIDLIHDVNPSIIEPYLEQILTNVCNETNQSIKRHYLRILSQHNLNEMVNGIFVDVCFKWLGMDETPIAVKAHCMTILYNLCSAYPEMIPELRLVLENLLPYGSKGEINRAKKILLQLDNTSH
nr:hypothetical protein [uncultured Carboxylicivirga sp.]